MTAVLLTILKIIGIVFAGDSWNHAFSAGSLIVCTGTLFRERNSR